NVAPTSNPYSTADLEDYLTLAAGDLVELRAAASTGGFSFGNQGPNGSATLRIARFNDVPGSGPAVTVQEFTTATSAALPLYPGYAAIPGLASYTAPSAGTYRASAAISLVGSNGYVGYALFVNGAAVEQRFLNVAPTSNPY